MEVVPCFILHRPAPSRVREAYGDSVYDRVVDMKAAYDPDNIFHHNPNIRPGGVE